MRLQKAFFGCVCVPLPVTHWLGLAGIMYMHSYLYSFVECDTAQGLPSTLGGALVFRQAGQLRAAVWRKVGRNYRICLCVNFSA